MNIIYNDKTDLLYIRFDDRKQEVINRQVSEDIVLDIGENDRIVGIEILDASRHLTLDRLLPVKYEVSKTQNLLSVTSTNNLLFRCDPQMKLTWAGWEGNEIIRDLDGLKGRGARLFLDGDCEEGVKDPVVAGLALFNPKTEVQSDEAICPGT